MKIRINITLKNGVLDTQGKAIENSLVKNLGFEQISNVRQGKLIELEINETGKEEVDKIVNDICDELLVNKVIENYSFEVVN
jgi:phosphoribosylformylglycinamidine synthase PurS subunit